jgi:hypothetical protein
MLILKPFSKKKIISKRFKNTMNKLNKKIRLKKIFYFIKLLIQKNEILLFFLIKNIYNIFNLQTIEI